MRPDVDGSAVNTVAVPETCVTVQNGAVVYEAPQLIEHGLAPEVTVPATSVLPAVIVPEPHELIVGIVPSAFT